jgi:hypothetical protein
MDMERIVPSAQAHPTNSRDEDVFSPKFEDLEVDDCCGILSSNGELKFFSEPGVFPVESPDGPSCGVKKEASVAVPASMASPAR